jgi:hypothetical protein
MLAWHLMLEGKGTMEREGTGGSKKRITFEAGLFVNRVYMQIILLGK